jgi:hypothetical protein
LLKERRRENPDRPQAARLRHRGGQLGAGYASGHPGLEHREADAETFEQIPRAGQGLYATGPLGSRER